MKTKPIEWWKKEYYGNPIKKSRIRTKLIKSKERILKRKRIGRNMGLLDYFEGI